MQNFLRIVISLAAFLYVGAIEAHTVTWMENPTGSSPTTPMVFYYPSDFYGYVNVDPSYFEDCTVQANLNASPSTLISAAVVSDNPANCVTIRVQILRAPINHSETATISGEWHATGQPNPVECDATSPNTFSVPIVVTDHQPVLRVLSINPTWITLGGSNGWFQYSSCLTGPWETFGYGQMVTVRRPMATGFYIQTRTMGRYIAGVVLDNGGSPVPNLNLGLQYNLAQGFTDSSGIFSLPRMPVGNNWLTLSNPAISSSLNMAISNAPNTSSNAYTAPMIKAAIVAAPLISPTNVCNCSPWCSIGFATIAGGTTPVYYAGGANEPDGGTADCGTPVVTVTPPTGAPFTITAGSGHHHNSGPNPASGTWTVTAVVCGRTKSASVTVP